MTRFHPMPIPSEPSRLTRAVLLAMAALAPQVSSAQNLNLAQAPLFLTTSVKPNLMVVYDNSESMDGTMAGQLIAGNDPSTRGNIARKVLRNTITTYRSAFNWGLTSFDVYGGPSKYITYAYYFGTDSEMFFTNTCVGGKATANGNLPCIANPDTSNGYSYITYGPGKTGDDPLINDVLYLGADIGPQVWGVGAPGRSPTAYDGFKQRVSGGASDWDASNFSNPPPGWAGDFTPTDAGYLPQNNPDRRMLWVRRAWGYGNYPTGKGKRNQDIAPDSATQYNALMGLLANETDSGNSEIKNTAFYTPLMGTLGSVRSYFNGPTTPITQSCQKNFVLLATDGNPTADINGTMYAQTAAEQSRARTEVYASLTALRSVSVNGSTYDVKTYVVGLGDSVANPTSISTLNNMANLGGTGTAYLASDEAALATSISKISNDILAQTSSASAVSLNGSSWSNGSRTFQPRFNSGDWSGQLLAYNVSATGALTLDSNWTDPSQGLNSVDWQSASGRQILSYNVASRRGVAFRWPLNEAAPTTSELSATMVAALNTNSASSVDGLGSQRLKYLRGDRSHEAQNCSGACTPVFRTRSSLLGDIVNSTPSYVGGGTAFYPDSIEPTKPYAVYKGARSQLTPMIYVGANDGMLHAFNGTTGAEVFAYVPAAVTGRLSGLTDPAYTHRYSVDGTPSVGDVFFNGEWHTLLVSGMNAGAKGLFALDVTDQSRLKESSAGDVVKWEIDGSDADVGYVFSAPTLTKTRTGQWMAIVGNGYNSSNGHAVLLLLNVSTGALKKIDTGIGGGNGLSEVVAVSSRYDGVTDIVYAGDLSGRLWKFDLSADDSSQWTVAYGGSPLFTAPANQAITARPAVTPGLAPGSFIVSFGTGRYLDVADPTSSSTQALYGIIDQGTTVQVADLQTQSVIAGGGSSYRLTTHAVGPAADTSLAGDNVISASDYAHNKKGWRLDLPASGERIVTAATVRNGRVIVSSLIPNTTPCSPGGDGWVLEVAITTGNRWSDGTLDTNGDGKIDSNDRINGAVVSAVHVDSIPARSVILRTQCADGSNCEIGITNTTNVGSSNGGAGNGNGNAGGNGGGGVVNNNGGGGPNAQFRKGSLRTAHRAAWEQIR